jgi:hypothetical protein
VTGRFGVNVDAEVLRELRAARGLGHLLSALALGIRLAGIFIGAGSAYLLQSTAGLEDSFLVVLSLAQFGLCWLIDGAVRGSSLWDRRTGRPRGSTRSALALSTQGLLVSVTFGFAVLTTAVVLLKVFPWATVRHGVLHWPIVLLAFLCTCLAIAAHALVTRRLCRSVA